MKVLIIDDDETMIGIWSTVLKKEDIEVMTAASGKLGIELAQKNTPDFILLDQIITDMKGNDVLKLLKSNPATATIPVALVSNYSEPDMMHDAIESGAIDYILKYQIDPTDLANKIKTLLHGSQPLNAPTMAAPGPAPANPTVPQSTDPAPAPVTPPSPAPAVPASNAAIAQPQVIDPNQTAQAQPGTPPADPVVPQPVVIDPTKPTQ